MRYFDCNCEVGPRNGKDPVAPWRTQDVIGWMDHCGISGALVVHTLSIHNDPLQARELLAREIRRAPKRLFPVWVILPPDARDGTESPAELLESLATHRVRAVKFFPKTHAWPMALPVIGPTLEALEKERILTLINSNELGGTAYDTLAAILARFPKLPVLLQNAKWGEQRIVTALMARYPNLHIEFSAYQINRGIEEYVQRFGAGRLLFGTGLPAMSAGAARTYVDYAQVPPAGKEAIAGQNLSRLLKGIVPVALHGRQSDSLRGRAARGKPLGMSSLYDAHCHVLHDSGHSAGSIVMYCGDAKGLAEMQDMLGIRKTALMSWVGPSAGEPTEGNDIVAQAARRCPRRFLGVAYVNPTHLTRAQLMSEVRKRVERQGFVGLKPYLRTGIKYSAPLYAPCWEYAERLGLYCLLHLGGPAGGPETVVELADRYPHAQWVVAHTGSSFDLARKVAVVMRSHPNVWAELTYTTVTNGLIEWLVSEVGDERILFGTDFPMRDPRPQLGWVVWADIALTSRKRILGGNFRRLLKMRRDIRGREHSE